MQILQNNILIDTNILIYSINADSPKHIQAQKFLKENIAILNISHQNILEAIRVLTHQKFPKPMKINDALSSIKVIYEALQIILPNQSTFYFTMELIKTYKITGNRIFDAYLAATALSNGLNTIATDNEKDFKGIEEIKIYNPFSRTN